jgi:hypothetical protein
LLESSEENVQIEAVAALANLAVNDENEVSIGEKGALPFIVDCMRSHNIELLAQASRALRNLSVDVSNKDIIFSCGGFELLQSLSESRHERIASQARRALVNLGKGARK